MRISAGARTVEVPSKALSPASQFDSRSPGESATHIDKIVAVSCVDKITKGYDKISLAKATDFGPLPENCHSPQFEGNERRFTELCELVRSSRSFAILR